MNRYRLNQLLEVLLFPVSDSRQGEKSADVLLSCYEAYHCFMEASHSRLSNIVERQKWNQEYHKKQKMLVSYLFKRNHGMVKSEDYIQMLCELYYPMSGIEHHMNYFKEMYGKQQGDNIEVISNFYFKILKRISRALISYRDGTAAVCYGDSMEPGEMEEDIFGSSAVYNKIEIWNLLCRITAPDIYIVIAGVEHGLGLESLFGQHSDVMLADRLLMKILQKGVAENHLHFNVGFNYEVRWLHYMDLRFVEKKDSKQWGKDKNLYRRLEMALFRLIAAVYLTQVNQKDGFCCWLDNNGETDRQIVRVIRDLYEGTYSGQPADGCIKWISRLYQDVNPEYAVSGCDYLLEKIYREFIGYRTSSEFILLFQCYQYIKQNEEDTFFARVFLQYIRLKNESFYEIHEQHVLQGLKYFQGRYAASKHSMGKDVLPIEDMMLEVFRSQAKLTSLKKLEIRVAPKVKGTDLDHFNYDKSRKLILQQLFEQVTLILNTYRRFILENMVSVPSLGIVFHFLKADDLEDLSGDYCWYRVVKTMSHRSSSHMHRRYFMRNVAMALVEMRTMIPKLDEYIVGIDAASDENAMEPWLFAPTYRAVRSPMHTKPVIEMPDGCEKYDKVQDIGFTYHVGEDFRHILSGLRHVDEVLEEFGYRAGDRLGHALVLGTDAEQWIHNNEMVPIPLLEYMEDFLWIWGVSISGGIELSVRQEIIEDKILDIAKKIYDNPETITVKMLYKAYRKKFSLNHKEIAEKIIKSDDVKNIFCCCDSDTKRCYSGWTIDKILMANYCPIYAKRCGRIELISVTKQEVALYQQLQEYLTRKVERMGVYIETNPTSNLTIGDFSQMDMHPVFQLNQRINGKGHRAFVTINSDDPAVFNTNVENELAYIYYAAENQGYAKSEILEWIDKIRQYGMDASFVQEEKSAGQILTEIEQILKAIGDAKI